MQRASSDWTGVGVEDVKGAVAVLVGSGIVGAGGDYQKKKNKQRED
jgi:hypothetical protein